MCNFKNLSHYSFWFHGKSHASLISILYSLFFYELDDIFQVEGQSDNYMVPKYMTMNEYDTEQILLSQFFLFSTCFNVYRMHRCIVHTSSMVVLTIDGKLLTPKYMTMNEYKTEQILLSQFFLFSTCFIVYRYVLVYSGHFFHGHMKNWW
jgi:hypothetical protein